MELNSAQIFVYLRVYTTTQRPIIKKAGAKKETKQTRTHNNLYYLDSNNDSIDVITPKQAVRKNVYVYIYSS
jgi:hypothetical protein